jgi:hypothetical protein
LDESLTHIVWGGHNISKRDQEKDAGKAVKNAEAGIPDSSAARRAKKDSVAAQICEDWE